MVEVEVVVAAQDFYNTDIHLLVSSRSHHDFQSWEGNRNGGSFQIRKCLFFPQQMEDIL